jgi:hypothetical protein
MLQEKYLPVYDVCKSVNILIDADASAVYTSLCKADLQWPGIVTFVMKLRGMRPIKSFNLQHLNKSMFILLEAAPEKEIILGLTGKFWTTTGHLKKLEPREFATTVCKGFAKATWSFELTNISEKQTMLKTETRVFCDTKLSKLKFRLYWFFIEPFSTMIRKEILKSIKRQATSI